MAEFQGQVVMVTGAGSGIGKATARMFAEEGASVVLLDIDKGNLEKTATEIASLGGKVISDTMDVTDEAQWERVMQRTLRELGKLNVLCNIAGIGSAIALEEYPVDKFRRELEVNLTGPFLGCKHGVLTIKRNGEPGAIINLGSISSLGGSADQAGYTASKAGVRNLTRSVGLYCAKKGYRIRCNAVHPSYVNTPMFAPLEPYYPDRASMLTEFAKDVPIGRVCEPEDIANTCLFLASSKSAMITASEIIVDGGHTAGFANHFGL
jgi:3(or 17)beta-hydroxysteroid dehydrogenase